MDGRSTVHNDRDEQQPADPDDQSQSVPVRPRCCSLEPYEQRGHSSTTAETSPRPTNPSSGGDVHEDVEGRRLRAVVLAVHQVRLLQREPQVEQVQGGETRDAAASGHGHLCIRHSLDGGRANHDERLRGVPASLGAGNPPALPPPCHPLSAPHTQEGPNGGVQAS